MRGFADLTVAFGDAVPGPTRSGAPWREVAADADRAWRLLTNVPEAQSLANALLHEASGGAWKLWLVGELFGYAGRPAEEGVRALLTAFGEDLRRGGADPAQLNGHFLLMGLDTEQRQWHVWTNRLGTFHAYHGAYGAQRLLSTYYRAVSGGLPQRSLDWEGVTGYLAQGFFPADTTFLKQVKILKPATHHVFEADGTAARQQRYWQWRYQPDASRTFEETVEAFGQVLNDTLADMTRTASIAVPLSGGLDSRTAAAVVTGETGKPTAPPRFGEAALQERLWSYSYGYTSYSPETAIGRQIAEARGLPFDAFVIPPYLFDRLDANMRSVEGFQGVVSTRQAAISEEIAAHADYLLAAHWGDVWMDDMGLLDRPEATQEEVAQHILKKTLKKGRQWLLEAVCAPQLNGVAPKELLTQYVRQGLAPLASIEEPDFRVKAYKTDHWSFRWTAASLRMFLPGAFVRLPFYDNRMVDLCCTIPSSYVAGRRLQIAYLKSAHPDVARIPWEETGYSLFRTPPTGLQALAVRAWRKAGRILKRQPSVGRNWEVQFLNEKGRQGLQQELLREALPLHAFVSPDQIRTLVEEMQQRPTAHNGYAVSMLLSLSMAMQYYLEA